VSLDPVPPEVPRAARADSRNVRVAII